MTETEIIDTTYYSIGFPKKEDNGIDRENYLSQIESYLIQDIKLIFIEGDSDAGKTTFCAQYCRRNPMTTVSVFFNPLSSLDLTQSFFCSNLVYQFRFLLSEEIIIADQEIIGFEIYQQYVFQIKRYLKKTGKKIQIVIDGLENLIQQKDDFVNDILNMLPLGDLYFDIVITGEEESFKNSFAKNSPVNSKPLMLSGFTPAEIHEYLNLPNQEQKHLSELYKITKGYPGRLKTLKRILRKDEITYAEIISQKDYQSWIEIDCRSVNLEDSLLNAVFSLLCLSDKTYTKEEIAQICNTNLKLLSDELLQISVLTTIQNKLSFVSKLHKTFFSNLLRVNERAVQKMLINYYTSSSSINSLLELPKLYAQDNSWPELLTLLDDNYSSKIIESTESLTSINENLQLGLIAAEKTKKYPEMWRYSFEASILNELESSMFWDSEVNARMALGDFAGAIVLAESAMLKVDRLNLLALIAKKQKEINKVVDEGLLETIQNLYDNTDLLSVGDKIYEIVSNLIYALPNLAIEMIEKSSGEAKDKTINDWIFAKLSLAAIDSSIKEKEDITKSKKIEAVETLGNPESKKIHKAITFLVANYSATKVTEEVARLTDSTEKLRLIRLWLTNKSDDIEDVSSVISMGLDELIMSSSKTTITLDILRELSQKLPYVHDKKVQDKLYYRFKTIENSLSDLGLTKNNYVYFLTMLHTEYILDPYSATGNVHRLIKKAEKIDDLLVKLECLNEIYCTLKVINDEALLRQYQYLYPKILCLTEEIIDKTAKHLKILKHILNRLGLINPLMGIKISNKINLQIDRFKSIIMIQESYLSNNVSKIKVAVLNELKDHLFSRSYDELFCINVLERFAEEKILDFKTVQNLLPYFDASLQFQYPSSRCYALTFVIKIICANSTWKDRLLNKYKIHLTQTLASVDSDWDKIDTGFTIASDLALLEPSFAKEIFTVTEVLKKDSWMNSKLVAHAYVNTLKLVVRSFSGLLKSKSFSAQDEQNLERLISRIPSEIQRLELWVELCLHAYILEEGNFAKKIYNTYVLTAIETETTFGVIINSIPEICTLVYLFNAELLPKYLDKFGILRKEQTYSEISSFIITKQNPFDSYDVRGQKYKANFSDLSKAISLLEPIKTDSILFWVLELLCKTLSESKSEISKAQNVTLIDQLEKVIKGKFPDAQNILHAGYAVLSEAKILKAKRENSSGAANWELILESALQISNTSDKIFVCSILIEDIPFDKFPRLSLNKEQLYDIILQDLESFQVHFEFIQRVGDISERMYLINRVKWKKIIDKAFSFCSNLEEGSEAYNSQKGIIDSIYRLDPAYAKELIKLSDKDSKSTRTSELLGKHVETLEIADKIKNSQPIDQKEKANYKQIIRGLMQAYQSINSDKVASKKIQDASSFLYLGNKLPLHECYPIYLYYLSNCVKTYGNIKISGENLQKENFKKLVGASQIIEILSNKKKTDQLGSAPFILADEFASSISIKPGHRDDGMNFIYKWISEEMEEFILIVDPYLKKEDIQILRFIKSQQADIHVNILGSEGGSESGLEDEIRKFWEEFSEEEPPYTNITFAWLNPSKRSPFHDRWMITKNSGIRLGTSISSIGIGKESEISVMTSYEATRIKDTIVLEYIDKRKRFLDSSKVNYKSFTL